MIVVVGVDICAEGYVFFLFSLYVVVSDVSVGLGLCWCRSCCSSIWLILVLFLLVCNSVWG